MALRDQIMQLASQDPGLQQAVDAMEAQLSQMNIVPEDLDEAIKVLEFVLQNPDRYDEVRQAIIANGILPEQAIPPQFDPRIIVSMLVALYGLQDRLTQRYGRSKPMGGGPRQMGPGMAGPMGQLAAQGRGGDTELVHVNPREKEMLSRMGGSGAVNPNTGLREYKSDFWKAFSVVAPIVGTFLLPGIGGAIGGALTGTAATSTTAAIAGGAALGAGSSAIGGGDPLKGALTGAIGGGIGKAIGSGLNSTLNAGMSEGMQNVVGSGIAGAGMGAAYGDGVLEGAARGVAGGVIGNAAGELGGNVGDRAGAAITGAGQSFGSAITSGADLKQAGLAGLVGAAGAGLQYKDPIDLDNVVIPGQESVSRLVVDPKTGQLVPAGGQIALNPEGTQAYTTGFDAKGRPILAETNPTTQDIDGTLKQVYEPLSPKAVSKEAPDTSLWGQAKSVAPYAAAGALALGALGGVPEEVPEAISTMDADQQEYFSRPLNTWDWDSMRADAAEQGLGLNQYMARNWNVITGGKYDVVSDEAGGFARGGALTRYARGTGSGRADTINARLSDGEYVMDAETVALLGDGSGEEGARRLNQMRQQLRKQKGKALAKGEFSPNAKSPLSYIKEETR